MKKLLKLLFVLTGTITLPLSVIACKQETLDNTLNIIYKGDTKYDIKNLFPNKDTSKLVKKYTLSINESEEMAKKIAEIILKKDKNQKEITWYEKNLNTNQKCYNFSIDNGEKDDDKNDLTWIVNQINEMFTIEISYQVGIINSEQKFVANQKINMKFDIKCGISESDKIVDEWIKQFNKQNWNINNPINIDLTNQKIDLPESGKNWSDLDKKVIEATYNAIKSQITWPKEVSFIINNIDKIITKDLKLNLTLAVNLNDARKNTDNFYILFN
ncbi:MAG: hypothetical protein ACRC8P_02050 [Spiroplasma sp.]